MFPNIHRKIQDSIQGKIYIIAASKRPAKSLCKVIAVTLTLTYKLVVDSK